MIWPCGNVEFYSWQLLNLTAGMRAEREQCVKLKKEEWTEFYSLTVVWRSRRPYSACTHTSICSHMLCSNYYQMLNTCCLAEIDFFLLLLSAIRSIISKQNFNCGLNYSRYKTVVKPKKEVTVKSLHYSYISCPNGFTESLHYSP